MNYSIEELNSDNIQEYAQVNILAWKQTYKGIISDEFIESFTSENGKQKIINNLQIELSENDKKSFLLKVDNKYAGILKIRKSMLEDFFDYGELGAIYLLNSVKGKGYGKILFDKAINELKNMGYKKMINGCFKGNPANEFYKHMGGKFLKNVDITLPNGEIIIENIYVYDIG